MPQCKKPIGRSMLIFGSFFIVILCILMSIQSAGMLKRALLRHYNAHMSDVVTYIEHSVDIDDLQQCLRTRTPSEKYNQLQQQLNTMVDDYELLYLFIALPKDDGSRSFYSVCTATSKAEREAGEEDFPIMLDAAEFYTPEQLQPYFDAINKPGEFSVFTVESVDYGHTHTVCKPLVASDGTTVGLICAEVEHSDLHRTINNYVISSIALIILICVVFAFAGYSLLKKVIVAPLRSLEIRAREFAENSRGKRDLNELTFNTPDIHTENEIQSLSEAITQMAEDMKVYVSDILTAEQRAETAEGEAYDLSRIAYEDSLTKAKSKVAYDERKVELDKAIKDGSAEFAVVMVNLVDSKRVDDIFGTEAGRKYIVSGSDLIRGVYPFAPVYRIGDNDFAVILDGQDYARRDELFAELSKRFDEAKDDEQREPWTRCIGVFGMTEFIKDADETADQVCRRAEMILFRNKRILQNKTRPSSQNRND
ncbi:MAG: diguanylate cyclase [Oscillospiraceae bacterium]|nr:diguanylate cyclase [Oscillospiraceae bacterium]